jgi:glycerate-2-kinase
MVKIKNRQELLNNAFSLNNRKAREIVLDVIEALLDEVEPKKIVKSQIQLTNETLIVGEKSFDLSSFNNILIVGGGKASGFMAEALEEILGDRIKHGLIVVPKGTSGKYKTKKTAFHEASHPIPDNSSVEGARKIVNLVSHAQEDDLVICLISGGGSSLMALPRTGILLENEQKVTDLLLKCGATINEINTIRKHISAFKGGQLAKAAYPATVLGLLLSDVLGDPLDIIASGPTVPDSSSFEDANKILKKYDLLEKVPVSVKKVLSKGEKGLIEETPKKDDPIFKKVYNVVIGNNRLACQAAVKAMKKSGLNTMFLSSFMEGEAREVGTTLSALTKEVLTSCNPLPPPVGIVVGGETTVTVTGKGKGGRNQELALAAAIMIQGLERIVISSISTDGVDGPTDAAGALVDGVTLRHSNELGLDARMFIKNNDSYEFFSHVGGLIYTGPTGTNVNDIIIMIVL